MAVSASIIGWESVGIFTFQFNASTIFVQTFLQNIKTDPIGYCDKFLIQFKHSILDCNRRLEYSLYRKKNQQLDRN